MDTSMCRAMVQSSCRVAARPAGKPLHAPCGAVVANRPRPIGARDARRATASTAASAATASATTAATVPASNILPLRSLDDTVQTAFVEPPATGRESEPLWVKTLPGVQSSGAGAAWSAPPLWLDINADVAACFVGLEHAEVQQVVDTHLAPALAALEAAARNLRPAEAARSLRRLDAQWGPALALVSPGGSSALVDLPNPHLAALLPRAAAIAREQSAAGQHGAAAATCLAALQLASRLRFGSKAAAEPYAVAVLALRQALTVAFNSGAPCDEAAMLCVLSACARADPKLHLAPYMGPRWAEARHAATIAGWSCAEAAVQAFESSCALVACGRLQGCAATFQRLADAPLGHADLIACQLDRLLAAEAGLAFTATLNTWAAEWQQRVQHRRRRVVHAEQQRQQAASAAAAQRLRAARHTATAAVELARSVSVHA